MFNHVEDNAKWKRIMVDDETSGGRWYVVHTRQNSEVRATGHLRQQGFLVFCPRLRRTVRHAGKSTKRIAPLFPGYVFLRLDLSRDRWRAVNGTRGVARLITHGDTPAPVPVGIVETLHARAPDGDEILTSISALHAGQMVRVANGPFAQLVGTLERLTPEGRVRVLLDVLGRAVPVALHCEALTPVT